MLDSITVATYLICAVAHLLVAGLLLLSRAQHRYKALLLGATLTTAVWSAVIAIQSVGLPADNSPVTPFVAILEQIRTVSWIAVMGYVLFVAYQKTVDTVLAAGFVGISVVSMSVVIWQTTVAGYNGTPINQSGLVASVAVSVCALVMVENLFRNAGREARWALKNLCFAVAVMFGYDLFFYAEALLFGRLNMELFGARGIVDAMIAPLVVMAAVRSKSWPIDLHVSRRLAFHSATILIAGVYLIGMSALGYYLRLLDSEWGFVARVGFIAAAILGLAMALSSASIQARIKGFISQNFFSNKYDYRNEWPRFISAISDNPTEMSIPSRILRALANIIDCTAGGLWVHVEEDDTYRLAEAWNVPNFPPNVSPQEDFVRTLAGSHDVIDLHGTSAIDPPLPMPAWLSDNVRVRLIVPLIHSSGLLGFAVLGRLRAARELDWEDYDLLKTAGRQAASYIAEDQAAGQLIKARRFEDFNRHFAFVVHDIKNLAGQMSLILKNAERYGDNPEFQKDVLATVADSLKRMQSLLDQINQRKRASAPPGRLDLGAALGQLASKWKMQIPGLTLAVPADAVEVVADANRIEAVMNHLVHNAAEAAGPSGTVQISLRAAETDQLSNGGGCAILEVIDNGPGMDQKFIEEKLFQPLDTTKTSGYGIGAYQAMFLVKEIGGRIEVDSEVGRGTRMIVRLPLAPTAGRTSGDEPRSTVRLVS